MVAGLVQSSDCPAVGEVVLAGGFAAQALRTRAVTRTPIHLMETDYPATDAVSSATRHRAQTGAVVLSPDVTSTASGAMTPRISVIVSEGIGPAKRGREKLHLLALEAAHVRTAEEGR
ncbi:Uncharacterised protein [Mycobacterium tuberculosis]|nr:Uncharacterised protein [Mycobacterium tuberculosis]